jgi:murein DD-endopeptidase MepM/ murein hydrolase activator NlpD
VDVKIDSSGGIDTFGEANQPISSAERPAVHIVSNNETLFEIAYKYNIDPTNLAKINGISPSHKLKNGQMLKLPLENDALASAEVGKEIPSYEDTEETDRKKKAQKDKLDQELEEILAIPKGATVAGEDKATTSKSKGEAKNIKEQEELSRPKVVETVGGVKKSVENEAKPLPSLKMRWPVRGSIVSNFGDVRDGAPNDGINIKAPLGTKVTAASDGAVIYVGKNLEQDYGNVVIIQHDNSLITSYAHLNDVALKNGASVRAGDVVGSVGKTGDVTEPQLYFEIMKDKKPVNPMNYLKK